MLDLDHPNYETYIKSVRALRAQGIEPPHTPAMNPATQAEADILNRRLTRLVIGRERMEALPTPGVCVRCGRYLDPPDALIVRSIYTRAGRRDSVICRDGCPA